MDRACSAKSKKCREATIALNRCLTSSIKPIAKEIALPIFPPQSVCAALYLPVCAENSDGFFSVYSNSCEANKARAKEVSSDYCAKK